MKRQNRYTRSSRVSPVSDPVFVNAISQGYVIRKRSWLLCCFRPDIICQCYISMLCSQEEKLIAVLFQIRYLSVLYLKAMFTEREASCCAVSDPIFVNAISQGYVLRKRSWLLCCFRPDICQCYILRLRSREEKLVAMLTVYWYVHVLYFQIKLFFLLLPEEASIFKFWHYLEIVYIVFLLTNDLQHFSE